MGNQHAVAGSPHLPERPQQASLGAPSPQPMPVVEQGAKEAIYVGGTLQDGVTPHGRGSLVYSSLDPERSKYEGDWENGQRHGKGRLVWKNGKIYEGEWKHDKLNGKGRLRWINGMEYEGDFESNAFAGTGMLRWPTGKAYYGKWARGKQNGEGTLTYPQNDPKDRVAYQGYWVNDKRENMGRMVWKAKNGNGQAIYEGNWHRNKREGVGTYYFEPSSDCEQYHGEWHNGKRHGYGTLRFRNGDVYAGFWFKDDRHGRGTLTTAHGRVIHELHLNGTKQPIEPTRQVPQSLVVLCIEKLVQVGISRKKNIPIPAELRERLVRCEAWHRRIVSKDQHQLGTLHNWFGLLPPQGHTTGS